MKSLNICFIGIGSIAKRHIRNLVKIAEMDGYQFTIDAIRRSACGGEEDVFSYINHVYLDVEDTDGMYDAIFITNPTEMHMATLEKVTKHGKNFFIEKPSTSYSQIEEAESYDPVPGAVYYVACPLRYHSVIRYLKQQVDPKEVISIRSISSSYLPNWRKGVDYRKTYSAHQSMGGGVSLDLIHEWDYLTYLFGQPSSVVYMGGKKSSLEIDSDDYAIYMADYEDKILELHLDYFGRKTMRKVTLFTKEDTLVGDLVNHRISYLETGRIVDFNEERDDFQTRELKHFLDMVEGRCQSDNTVSQAIKTLKLTRGITGGQS